MAEQKCETCRFWKHDESYHYEGMGDCHRRAPLPVLRAVVISKKYDQSQVAIWWPSTDESDWCGEWQAGTPEAEQPTDPSREKGEHPRQE